MRSQNNKAISAIILAAGLSSRMGKMKALLPFGMKTAVERAVALFEDAGINDIVVVTGHRAKQISQLIEMNGVRLAYNPDYCSGGMLSSVKTGVRSINADSQGFFLLPVDIPLVRPYTVRYLLQAHARFSGKIIRPCYGGRNGHPPLIPAALIPHLLAWQGTEGLRGCLAGYAPFIMDIDVPDRYVLADMDTPDDYQRLVSDSRHWDVPTRGECDLMLQSIFPVPQDILQHSRQVAAVAIAIGSSLRSAGIYLDLDLTYAAALLHDIAKGHRSHANVGGKWLTDIGLPRIANIVAAHTDLELNKVGGLTEKEVVYLADKLVHKDKLISLDKRFELSLKNHAHNPEALHNITSRHATAHHIQGHIEMLTQLALPDILFALPKSTSNRV